jgi:hypothetical protein
MLLRNVLYVALCFHRKVLYRLPSPTEIGGFFSERKMAGYSLPITRATLSRLQARSSCVTAKITLKISRQNSMKITPRGRLERQLRG